MRRVLIGLVAVAFFLALPLVANAESVEDTRAEFKDAGFTDAQVDVIVEHLGEHSDEHVHGDGTFFGEVTALLTDGAHWILEVITEITFFIFELFLLDKLLHIHTRHGKLRSHG